MKTELLEFKNKQILRGIIVLPKKITQGVIMIGGFEGNASVEKKFKTLSDELLEHNIASFRIDYTGCGLSDGDFSEITIKQVTDDLFKSYNIFKNKIGVNNISVAGHSMGCCAISNLEKENIFNKILFLAPALNQKELLRYWFVKYSMKEFNPKIKITWENYKKNLVEKDFQKFCRIKNRMTDKNYVSYKYYLENENCDYLKILNNHNLLIIHGQDDDVVPIKSLENKRKIDILVRNGDHDLERPDIIKQWKNKAIKFLIN